MACPELLAKYGKAALLKQLQNPAEIQYITRIFVTLQRGALELSQGLLL